MAVTNTLIHNTPYIDEDELNTTREKKSIFIIYSMIDDYKIGCEFTTKKISKFPRYECKTCRRLCDKDKRAGVGTDSPASVTTVGNEIQEVKKATHHAQCRVEFKGTALARSYKNAAVVHKSHYGGSCKQVYDTHTQMTPKGYKQTYMLWYIAEGNHKDEVLPRSKAMLSVTFILKGKSEAIYEVAFGILENYRKENLIPEPPFCEYITDDEPAVRNVVEKIYPNTEFAICHFHHNQNVVKCLAEHKLTTFIRKCKTDEQLWFYGKIKQILVLPLLPADDIIPAFKSLSQGILSFIDVNFTNQYEVDQFNKYFETIEARYFSNPEKIKLTCKYRKHMRCTNLIESTHNVFNNSKLIRQHGTVSNFVEAMTTIDLQYRTTAIAFEAQGASTFPKKKKRYVEQQRVIDECTTDLDNGKISSEEFLKKCSECMIHEKYFKLIEAATERLEKLQDSGEDQFEVDEHIMAIFASSESSSGRIRTLCSKYFGDEWLN